MKRLILTFLLAYLASAAAVADGILIIAHPTVPKTDLATLQRIYTGKVIEINSVSVTPFNAPVGSQERNRFLRDIMQQDEEKYTGYWTVRRYIGKGTPPKELANASEMISTIQSTPGAIGYIHESEWKPGLTILLKR